jgi:uncharacterized protein YciI
MKVAAILDYISDTAKIASIRPAHRQYLSELRERGQLVICGPFTDDTGGLIVYETASPADAEKIIQGDPFYKNGIIVKFQIRPWKVVMGNAQLLAELS